MPVAPAPHSAHQQVRDQNLQVPYQELLGADRYASRVNDVLARTLDREARGKLVRKQPEIRRRQHALWRLMTLTCRDVWQCGRAHELFLILRRTPREPGRSNFAIG